MKISEIGTVVTGKTPSTSILENYGGNYPFITPNELHHGYMVSKPDKFLTEKGLESIRSNSISGKSVLVGCIGWDIGNVAMYEGRGATNQQINSITDINADVNPAYLYYWFKTKKDYISSIASVTRTPILSKTDFEDIDISLPYKQLQDLIAENLSRLDRLIELNEQANDNLPMAA